MKKPLLRMLLLLLCAQSARAVDSLLEVTTWVELEPAVSFEEEQPLTRETAHRRLLEQARRVLGGMVYGYRFRYVPSDRARGVAEQFDLEPLHEILWGDPRLRVSYVQEREKRLWSKVAYDMAPFQAARRESWSSNVVPVAAGRGERSILEGHAARLGSVDEAIKQAIRAHGRQRISNKPREMRGEILLWEPPRTIIDEGAYVTTVRIKLQLEDVTPYRVF